MNRPSLTNKISAQDFKDFYWLKEELIAFCKKNGINSSGGKIEIAKRISLFLSTGTITKQSTHAIKKATSKFDWTNERLTLETAINDNYKNSENVRLFFSKEIGSHFHFTVAFMKWARENVGKTLRDAVEEWKRLHELKKDKSFKTEIAPQFEYNRYMRNFLEDNPDKTSKDAMKYWKRKRATRGSKEYSKSDLDL
ncbi:MAG: SAP domain-containing protein [Cyclobacteriaceae bacterium]|nr:SAP domain-containing protein [Cyclobacteriaceae bacterium]